MSIWQMATLGLVLATASPALHAADEAGAEQAPDEKVCLNSNLVRNFDALSDEHIFVEERNKEFYLLTMRNRCFDLRHAHTIALKDVSSRICSDGFGEVIYRTTLTGPFESCFIDTVEKVDNKNAAKELVAARQDARKKEANSR